MSRRDPFKIEVLGKFIAKFSGLIKQCAILFIIGRTSSLDFYFVAMSFVAIILSFISWSEIQFIPKLEKSSDENGRNRTFTYYNTNISAICILILLSICIITHTFVSTEMTIWVALVGIWAIINVINNLLLICFRVEDSMKAVFSYYSKIASAGMLIFLLLSGALKIFQYNIDFVFALYLSVILPEIYFLIKWRKYKTLFCVNSLELKKFSYNNLFNRASINVVVILILVYAIDATDKLFSTFGDAETNGASLLVYGSLAPLVFRSVFDVKTLFFSRLHRLDSIKEKIVLLCDVLKRVLRIYIPTMALVCLIVYFFGERIGGTLGLGFTKNELQAMIHVFYVYAITVPVYIYWDLCYRFYHIYGHSSIAVFLVLLGMLTNLVLNYYFVFELNLGAVGISIATFAVYLFYSIVSTGYLYKLGQNKGFSREIC